MITLCFVLLFIKGFFCLTITTPPEINVTLNSNSSIILNCTYELKAKETIRNIYWKKKTPEGNYQELVDVSVTYAAYTIQGSYLKNRSELHRFGNGSTSVVLIIKDVRCIDNGQYQCFIRYTDVEGSQTTTQNNTAVYIQENAKEPVSFSVQPNSNLEEHGIVKLSCVGDVGNPQGSLKIWKTYKNSSTTQLLKYESEVKSDTVNCTHIANLTTTYNLTKDDNGAVIRCSSQNQYTKEPAPATDIGPIEVFYGPSTTSIRTFFPLSDTYVGYPVKFECISDGNPNPQFTWMFNFTEIVSDGKYKFSASKSELSFNITNITDSGYYQCVASNYIKGKLFNSSSNVTITVRNRSKKEFAIVEGKACFENSCSPVQNCVIKNDSAFCSLNVWIVIAIVFIMITLILCATTLSFILLSRTQWLKSASNTQEMDMGDYLSPVGEATGSNYEDIGQNTVHEYSTMQNRDLVDQLSNYEGLGQGTVHVYSTMQNRDIN